MIPINEKTYKADEGMKFTNGESFGVIIYLGSNDSIDNWHEITEAEAERLQNEETLTETETDYINTLNEKDKIIDILSGEGE